MHLAQKVSADAVANARNAMAGYGWSEKSLNALSPMPGEGTVGIKTSQKYLMHQERGTKPFLMWWVAGKNIPLKCNQGDGPHFRRGGHVGEPGMVDIPHVGETWRNERWKHPGVQPRNFMAQGLQQAIQDNQPTIKQWVRSILGPLGGTR
jgi:hypothetical protein